jgi:hypothetical protein
MEAMLFEIDMEDGRTELAAIEQDLYEKAMEKE